MSFPFFIKKNLFIIVLLSLLGFLYLPVCGYGADEIIINCANWEPYTGENLENGGFYTEITVEALKEKGYSSVIKFLPWKRALFETKKGKATALIGASYTKERTSYFVYPDYNWEMVISFFAKKGSKQTYKRLEDLCPAKIGMVSGTVFHDMISKIDCLKPDTGYNLEMNLKKFAKKRLDYVVDSNAAFNYTINNKLPGFKDIFIKVYPPLKIDKVFTVFSKKNPLSRKISKDFDAGIITLKKDGRYLKIIKKHGIK